MPWSRHLRSPFVKVLAVALMGLGLFFWTSQIRRWLDLDQDRRLLAVVQAQVPRDGRWVQVNKLLDRGHLRLEIFELGTQELKKMQEIELGDTKDAQFSFRGEMSNLILQPLEDQGTLILMAPGMGSKMEPHLNAYRFSSETGLFIPVAGDVR